MLALVTRMAAEALSTGRTLLSHSIGHAAVVRLRRDLFDKLQALSLSYHRTQPLGEVVHRLIVDTTSVRAVLATATAVAVSMLTLLTMTVVLLVTHRLAAVSRCDTIFVLERGRVVERGTHAELIQKDGAYARLRRLALIA